MLNILKSKKFIIVLLVVLVALALFFVIRARRQIVPAPSLPKPSIPRTTSGEFEIQFSISKKDFKLPNSAPILERGESTYSPSEIQKVAQNLGIEGEPQKAKDTIEGDIFIYQNETAYLIATPQKGKMEYRLLTTPNTINKQLSDSALTKIASDFLTQNGFTSSDKIKFTSILPLKAGVSEGLRPIDKQSASFYQVNFSPKVSGFDVLTTNPLNSPVYVRVLPDGNILGVSVNKFDSIREGTEKFRLKNFDQIIASTKDKEAIVVSLDQGNLSSSDLPANTSKKATVTEIGLAYLLDPGNPTLLQPVYVLKGEAEIGGLPNNIEAVFYLPALASP